MNKAIFFDRDGIVNHRLIDDYVKSVSEFVLLDDFIALFKQIKELGYLAILITNQQGIGKGLMNINDLKEIHDFMQNQIFANTGYHFDDIYYCSDLAASNSFRRKPNPGMILEAIEKWNINPEKSWFIGDSKSDAKAGNAANVNTILIGNFENDLADLIFPNLDQLNKKLDKIFAKEA